MKHYPKHVIKKLSTKKLNQKLELAQNMLNNETSEEWKQVAQQKITELTLELNTRKRNNHLKNLKTGTEFRSFNHTGCTGDKLTLKSVYYKKGKLTGLFQEDYSDTTKELKINEMVDGSYTVRAGSRNLMETYSTRI